MLRKTDILIIGAGPFGLSLGAFTEHHHLDYLIVGRTMSFWKENMPEEMWLRSGSNWHLDPMGEYTFKQYLEANHKGYEESEAIHLRTYLDYTEWFLQKTGLKIVENHVSQLDSNRK